jgi:uncharacterized phage infection (PIP) family protein YhgE
MKNKIQPFTGIILFFIPFILLSGYQILRNLDNGKLILALIGFIAVLGAFALTIMTFTLIKKKQSN